MSRGREQYVEAEDDKDGDVEEEHGSNILSGSTKATPSVQSDMLELVIIKLSPPPAAMTCTSLAVEFDFSSIDMSFAIPTAARTRSSVSRSFSDGPQSSNGGRFCLG